VGGIRRFSAFSGPWASRYCAKHGTNARFGLNVRFSRQVIRKLPRLSSAGFAYSAAAPLGATNPAPSVGADKTEMILKCAAQMQLALEG
jgi:hypothetical protein